MNEHSAIVSESDTPEQEASYLEWLKRKVAASLADQGRAARRSDGLGPIDHRRGQSPQGRMNLIWLPAARRDIETVVRFIAEHITGAAQRVTSQVEACAERLPEHPFLYRPGRVPGTREAVVHPNYILIHRVTTEAVEVVSLVHARQEYS